MDWLIVLWNLILLPLLTTGVHSFRFTILHNNDMHARYDPISSSCGKCPKGDDEKGLCFGGFARVATVWVNAEFVRRITDNRSTTDLSVTQARTEGSTLYLNAGDTFHGTNWYRLYKGDLAADLLNILNPDAVVGKSETYIHLVIVGLLGSPLATTNSTTTLRNFCLFSKRSGFPLCAAIWTCVWPQSYTIWGI